MNINYVELFLSTERSASSDAKIAIGSLTATDHTFSNSIMFGFHEVDNFTRKINQLTFHPEKSFYFHFKLIIDFPTQLLTIFSLLNSVCGIQHFQVTQNLET